MHLLLTTATATPVLVQKCIKQDPNQFRMSFHLSVSSQFYFYCISQQSSVLSRVSVNVTFSHLKKKILQLFPNKKCVRQQPQLFFFLIIQVFFPVIFNYFSFLFLYRNSTERRKFTLQIDFQGKQ